MNRLQGVKESDGVITEYEFDAFGNISREYTLTASGIKTTRYEYDSNNCLLISYDDKSSTRYTYDKSGNLTNKIYELSGRETKSYYIYDGYNRLSEFVSGDTTAEYTYNPEGLRESKTVNGNYTRFIYDGSNIVGELTNDNYYIYYRGTELISSRSYGNKNHFYRLDSHGNVTDLVNHLGESQKSYTYTPYGEEKLFGLNPTGEQTILYYWQKETDGTHNPFRYCGEYYDEESGLIYLRNRYYDPTSGRFITEDPHWNRDNMIYGDKETNTPDVNAIIQSNNLYAYCLNDPLRHTDPSGMITIAGGVDLSAAFLLKLGITGQIVVDFNGNVGVIVAGTIGGGTPSASVNGAITITSADEIFDLNGIGASGGFSWGLGVDVSVGQAQDGTAVIGAQLSGGSSIPIPEIHGDLTVTKVLSLNWLPKWIKNSIIESLKKKYEGLPKEIRDKIA